MGSEREKKKKKKKKKKKGFCLSMARRDGSRTGRVVED